MDEKFQSTAYDYAKLISEITVAERKAQQARTEYDNLMEAKNRLALQLREFVDANIRRKAAVTAGSLVVTVEFISDSTMPKIHVYENGEEISW